MSRGYNFTHSPVTDASAGDPTTGTLWCDAYEAAQDVLLNAVLTLVDADMTAVFNVLDLSSADTLEISYTSSSSVTVSAGQASADDGVRLYTISSATVVDCSSIGNSKNVFLWVGEDSISGNTELQASDDPDTAPVNLLHAHRLEYGFFQTDGSGNVIQFAAAKSNLSRGVSYPYNGKYRPANCLYEDGSSLGKIGSGATFEGDLFQELYNELEDSFGGTFNWNNGDTINLPDSRGRVCIGAGQGSGLTNRALGDALGEEAHALTSAENAGHTHTGPSHTHTGPSHTHTIYGFTTASSAGSGGRMLGTSSGSDATSAAGGTGNTGAGGTGATGSSGSGTAHNTMQPSLAKYMIIPY